MPKLPEIFRINTEADRRRQEADLRHPILFVAWISFLTCTMIMLPVHVYAVHAIQMGIVDRAGYDEIIASEARRHGTYYDPQKRRIIRKSGDYSDVSIDTSSSSSFGYQQSQGVIPAGPRF